MAKFWDYRGFGGIVMETAVGLQEIRCNLRYYGNTKQSLDRSWWVQGFEVPRFLDNRDMKVVRLSALVTGQLHHSRDKLVRV
jgi:hypothetical protein